MITKFGDLPEFYAFQVLLTTPPRRGFRSCRCQLQLFIIKIFFSITAYSWLKNIALFEKKIIQPRSYGIARQSEIQLWTTSGPVVVPPHLWAISGSWNIYCNGTPFFSLTAFKIITRFCFSAEHDTIMHPIQYFLEPHLIINLIPLKYPSCMVFRIRHVANLKKASLLTFLHFL